MALRQGHGKIVTDGLVFAYDTGDRKNSYQGPPTQNYAPTNVANCSSTSGWSGTSVHTQYGVTRSLGVQKDGRTTFHVTYSPYERTGDCYHTFRLTDVNGNNVQTNGGEVFYLQFEWKSEGAQYLVDGQDKWNLSTFYGNGWKNGSHLSAQDFGSVPIGNGWYRRTVKYTAANVANQTPLMRFSSGYKRTSGGAYQLWVANIAMTRDYPAGNWFPGQTVRSSTEGLLDLTGGSNIDLTNLSGYDSNAEIEFDGTNDRMQIPHNPKVDITGTEITLEVIARKDTNGSMVPIHKDYQYSIRINSDNSLTYADSSNWSYSSFGNHSTSNTNGSVTHITAVKKDGVVTLYVNGEVIVSKSFGWSISSTSNDLFIGAYSGSSNYMNGKIPVVKIYNRALTASEVQNNFNHYKGRFDL